jgi:hypothetical protein
MKITKLTLAHCLESSILLMSGLILYDYHKILYEFLKKKYPGKKILHKSSTLTANMIAIFILDLIFIIILDKIFDVNIV